MFLLKSLVGSVVAENSPMLVKAPPAWFQNTGDKKTTSAPEKPVSLKPKLAAAPEASKPEVSKSEATLGKSSSKNNGGGAIDFIALMNRQIEEFKICLLVASNKW